MQKTLLYSILTISFLAACTKSTKEIQATTEVLPVEDTIVLPKQPIYQATEKRVVDLIHTKLDVSFDWENRTINGEAWLDFTPYFHPQNSVAIDAKNMLIHEVQLCDSIGNLRQKLSFDYDSLIVHVNLDKAYNRGENFKVYIRYTGQPEKVKQGGSSAINDAKGLYFINHDESKPNVPRQLWTQGETESSSCWFPTIDIPNEKMTQEIAITVEKNFKTLSNGTLMFSTLNDNGTRTDVWKQTQPHPPYLAMMAVGDFAVITEEWRGKPVAYFVEHQDSAYAELVFGRTKEMLDFFSEKLGYEYPWDKYHQVVVREFISGAMENTSAVIHGGFVMRDSIEYLDANYEDVVSHELFHHWFGDLVTCESWSNLPLNESFATYGEYLWNEYKYGRDYADVTMHHNLRSYLRESQYKKEDMVRFDYHDKEDMFDAHSYQKGGCILHMLRNYLGDEVFFEGVTLYLHQNAYKTAEIHNLRMAFEEVSGEDLNWFFNQWFLDKGHPKLKYNYTYDEEVDSIFLTVEQIQDFEIQPLYQLPIQIDIYHGKKAKRQQIWVREAVETYQLKAYGEPDFINFDADKVLLGEKEENKSLEEWSMQMQFGPLYRDRYDALQAMEVLCTDSTPQIANDIIWMGLNDKIEEVRILALELSELILEKDSADLRSHLERMALKDASSSCRAIAINRLTKLTPDENTKKVYLKALKDSSTMVLSTSLRAIYDVDNEKGIEETKKQEGNKYGNVISSIAQIYAEDGSPDHDAYFNKELNNTEINRASLVYAYASYLNKQTESYVKDKLHLITDLANDPNAGRWEKTYAIYGLVEILGHYQKRLNDINADIADQEAVGTKAYDMASLKQRKERIQEVFDLVMKAFMPLFEGESPRTQKRLEGALTKRGVTL